MSVYPPEKYAKGVSLELLSMDSRIKVCSFYGDVQDDAGYLPTKKQLVFPCELPAASHQIAHMIEMTNPNRWTMIDWGMATPEGDFSNFKARNYFAALARETRVRAIQLHLDESLIYKSSTTYNIFMNSVWECAAKKYLPFGRFSSMKELEDWTFSLRDRTYFAWSVERVRHEWAIRLNHIRNWMETTA